MKINLLLGAFAFTLIFSLNQSTYFSTKAAEKNIPLTSVSPDKLAGGYGMTSKYSEDGVHIAIPGADSVGSDKAWQYQPKIPNVTSTDDILYQSFSLDNGPIEFSFSSAYYDDQGNTLSKSQNDDGGVLDLYVYDAFNDSQLALLRIFVNSGGPLNGSHSVELYGSSWGQKYFSQNWILGNATASSEFFIRLDKTNLFSSYIGGSEEITPLSLEYANAISPNFRNASSVYFKLSGNNGFTNTMDFCLKSINQQSLSNDGVNFIDTVAPKFASTPLPKTLPYNQEYTLPVIAYDLLSEVSYSIQVNGEEPLPGKTFIPKNLGALSVTLFARDSVGNQSSKTFDFQVTGTIEKPVITSLPTIEGGRVEPFQTLVFPLPEYEDQTGNAEVKLNLYFNEETEPFAVLSKDGNNQFSYFVSSTFKSGTYKLVYAITNSSGTTLSEEIVVNYLMEVGNKPSFVELKSSNILADYVEEGLRIRSSEPFVETSLGYFDLKYGVDLYFSIPEISSNGGINETNYFNLILRNKENPDYNMVYRVWHENSGADRPTNVYIETGHGYTDYTNTGWISRTVKGKKNMYHMAFDPNEMFIGERTGGMQVIDNETGAVDALVKFYKEAASTEFELCIEVSRLNAGNSSNFECIINEINGQSLKTKDGEITKVNDASLYVDALPSAVLINESFKISAYSKDIFTETTLYATIEKPDHSKEEYSFKGKTLDLKFTELGTYALQIYTIGQNGNKVFKDFSIVCKDNLDDITMTLNDTYQNQYDVGSSIKILPISTSDNVVKTIIEMKKPDNSKVTLTAESDFVFDKPGMYQLIYTSFDNAEPTPNSKELKFEINVLDLTLPIVSLTSIQEGRVGEEISISVNIQEESGYDVRVKIFYPDSTAKNFKLTAGKITFTPEVGGLYKVRVIVEDIYGNKVTKTCEINVKDGNGFNWLIPTGIILGVIAIGTCGVFLFLKKKKVKGGE